MSDTKALDKVTTFQKYPISRDEIKQAAAELEELKDEVVARRAAFELMTERLIAEEAKNRQLRAENAQLARAAAEAMVTADRANVQLRAENAEMREAVKQSDYALSGWKIAHPEEWDGVDERARTMNLAVLAKYPEEK